MGVCTSVKFLPCMYVRMCVMNASRLRIISWSVGRRRSRKRYCNRRSSFTSFSWSISNGGVFDSLKTVTTFTSTSISPVGLSFRAAPSIRLPTAPSIFSTHSGRICSAVLNASLSSGLNTTCVMP